MTIAKYIERETSSTSFESVLRRKRLRRFVEKDISVINLYNTCQRTVIIVIFKKCPKTNGRRKAKRKRKIITT